jgi:hypothetical protein
MLKAASIRLRLQAKCGIYKVFSGVCLTNCCPQKFRCLLANEKAAQKGDLCDQTKNGPSLQASATRVSQQCETANPHHCSLQGRGHLPRGSGLHPHEVAAVTGYARLKEITQYTVAADRKRLAFQNRIVSWSGAIMTPHSRTCAADASAGWCTYYARYVLLMIS